MMPRDQHHLPGKLSAQQQLRELGVIVVQNLVRNRLIQRSRERHHGLDRPIAVLATRSREDEIGFRERDARIARLRHEEIRDHRGAAEALGSEIRALIGQLFRVPDEIDRSRRLRGGRRCLGRDEAAKERQRGEKDQKCATERTERRHMSKNRLNVRAKC